MSPRHEMAAPQPSPEEAWEEELAAQAVPLVVVSPRHEPSRQVKTPRASVPPWVVIVALMTVTLVAAIATYLFLRSYP